MILEMHHAIAAISFKTLEMLEAANQEPVLLLKIFELMKATEHADQEGSSYDLRAVVLVDHHLYVKKFGADSVAVFPNRLFLTLDPTKHYIIFLKTPVASTDEDTLRVAILRLLKNMQRQIYFVAYDLETLSSTEFVIVEIIQSKLGV